MTAYHDSAKGPHFSNQYRQSFESIPSIFRKTNGEFSAYANAFAAHKQVMCKNFSL